MRYLTRILIFVVFLWKVSPQFHFKKIICNSTDPITVFEKCHIGIVNKSITTVTLHQKILQPVYSIFANITVIQLSKRMNRVLYRFTNIDACNFLIKRRNPVLRLMYLSFQKFSNVNHSCPYKDYLIINELAVKDSKLSLIPVISGEFETQLTWQLNGKMAANVSVSFRYTRK